MKKNLFFAAIAVAAIAVSCNKSEQPAEKGVTVNFTGEMAEETKMYLDPTTFQVKFTMDDKFQTAAIQGTSYKTCFIQVTSNTGVEPVTFSQATYEAGLKTDAQTVFFAGTQMMTGYPSPSKVANNGYTDYKTYTDQKITPTSITYTNTDVANKPAIMLFSFDTCATFSSDVKLKFHHIAAYGNLKIKNLNLAAEDQVKSIKISSTNRYFTTKLTVKTDCSITSGSTYFKYLNLDVTEMNITSGTFNVLFVTSPVDVSQTTTTITITTKNGQVFEKAAMAPFGKGNFKTGHILPFNVDFTGVEAK